MTRKKAGLTFGSGIDAIRTTLAAILSLLLARVLRLPEFYWAPISSIVIIQSTIDPLTISWQRFAGTAVGAVLGAALAALFPPNAIAYGAGILACGVVCALLRLDGAYRFAAITLSIVVLIAHTRPAWIVGLHRFVEVSLGIAVGLAVAVLWRRPKTT